MKKIAKMTALALASVMILSGCSSAPSDSVSDTTPDTTPDTASDSNAGGGAETTIVVGCSPQNMSNENVVRWVNAAQERADEYGNVKFIVNDGEGKPEKQVAQMDQFIAQGVDVIMVCPQDGDQLIPSVQEAISKGIPVVVIGAALGEDVGNSFVGSPDPVAGEMQMRAVAEELGGKGKIAVLRGPLGSYPEIQRFEGYQKVLDEYPDIEIVFDQSGEWDRGKGMSLMENLLQSGKEVDYVVAQNDEMALGALKTIEDAGLAGKIKVSGIDAIPDALNAVKEGRLAFTLLQNTEAQGKRAMEKCYEVVTEGAEPSEEMIPFEMVSADNVDSYLGWPAVRLRCRAPAGITGTTSLPARFNPCAVKALEHKALPDLANPEDLFRSGRAAFFHAKPEPDSRLFWQADSNAATIITGVKKISDAKNKKYRNSCHKTACSSVILMKWFLETVHRPPHTVFAATPPLAAWKILRYVRIPAIFITNLHTSLLVQLYRVFMCERSVPNDPSLYRYRGRCAGVSACGVLRCVHTARISRRNHTAPGILFFFSSLNFLAGQVHAPASGHAPVCCRMARQYPFPEEAISRVIGTRFQK